MISESGGRAVVIAPSALGSKDHPARLSKVPLRRIRQAIYPSRGIRRRNMEKDPWRVARHDNLPSSPSMTSRNEVWEAEGVSTFSLGVLVRGHGIHNNDGISDFRGGVTGGNKKIIFENKYRDARLLLYSYRNYSVQQYLGGFHG